ncbi:Os03g0789433, partial [Oryza sativa Japonica Group]
PYPHIFSTAKKNASGDAALATAAEDPTPSGKAALDGGSAIRGGGGGAEAKRRGGAAARGGNGSAVRGSSGGGAEVKRRGGAAARGCERRRHGVEFSTARGGAAVRRLDAAVRRRGGGERRRRGLHPRPPGATSIPQLTGATSDRLALDPSSTRSGDADPATGRRLLRPPAASPTDECRTADSPVGCFRVQKAKRAASRSSNRDEVIRKEEEQGRLQAELKKV